MVKNATSPLALVGLSIGLVALGGCGSGKVSTTAADGQTETGGEPGTGSESSDTGTGTGETGVDESLCELETYAACYADPIAALHGCVGGCGCGDSGCRDACHDTFEQDYWSCIPDNGQDCPSLFDQANTECIEQCFTIWTSCADAGCDEHVCAYDHLWCFEHCKGCPGTAEITFEYMDSCVLDLPEQLPPNNLPYVSVELEGMQKGLGSSGDEMCDEIYEVLWNEDFTSLELCPEPCMQFAEVGVIVVGLNGPPCE